MIRGILQQVLSGRPPTSRSSRRFITLGQFALACILLIEIALVAAALLWRDGEVHIPAPTPMRPRVDLTPGVHLSFPGRNLTIEIARYGSEVEAYSAVSHLRSEEVGGKFLVTVGEAGRFVVVRSELPNDLLMAIAEVARLKAAGIVNASDWAVTDSTLLQRWWDESRLFDHVYAPLSTPVTRRQTSNGALVADIAITSSFFDLPIGVFLLPDAPSPGRETLVWQQRPKSGSVALVQSSGKYLTVPRESVEWQETRTALQSAHELYVSDHRDYRALPDRLRPPRDFREGLQPPVLVTYAALLLRDLADKSLTPGRRLVALINSPPDDPNARHETGVRRALLHARRALAHALVVNRECLLEPECRSQ